MGLSHLSPIANPISTPFKGYGFLMTFNESCLPSSERESHSIFHSKAHTLECQNCGSTHWEEDLGCTRPSWM